MSLDLKALLGLSFSSFPTVTKDGKLLAYLDNRSGNSQIWFYSQAEGHRQITFYDDRIL